MTAVSPIKLPSEARTLSLPTLAFVVNPEGQAGIVYDSPTGKRTVIARGGPVENGGQAYTGAVGFVQHVVAYWTTGRVGHVSPAIKELERARFWGWTQEVNDRKVAKVLERGEL